MLAIEPRMVLTAEILTLTVKLTNAGAAPIWAATRVPWGLEDLGTLAVSGGEPGVVHLQLDQPLMPPGMRLYAPPKVFCRRLEPGAVRRETFTFALPLVEASPTQPRANETALLQPERVTRLKLTVGWAFEAGHTSQPITGQPELFFVFPDLPQKARAELDVPSDCLLRRRSDRFTRF